MPFTIWIKPVTVIRTRIPWDVSYVWIDYGDNGKVTPGPDEYPGEIYCFFPNSETQQGTCYRPT